MRTWKEIQNTRHLLVDYYKLSVGCAVCGYKKHPSALCFDHLPNEEKNEVTKNGYSKKSCAGGMFKFYSKKHSIEELINEIKKCKVLCSNCHMESTHTKNIRNDDFCILSLDELEFKLKQFEEN